VARPRGRNLSSKSELFAIFRGGARHFGFLPFGFSLDFQCGLKISIRIESLWRAFEPHSHHFHTTFTPLLIQNLARFSARFVGVSQRLVRHQL
jgi:hypothetical protein